MKLSNKKISAGKNSNRGFTLIELIVVTGIIAVISVLIVANYRQGNRQVALDMQVNKFAQDLRRVQEWAMAAHQVGGAAKLGYGMHLSQGDSSYTIYLDDGSDGFAIFPGNGNFDDNFDTEQETVALDGNIEAFQCIPNPANVEYMVPEPATRINGDDSQMTQRFEFRVKGTTAVRSVVVNKAGLIYVE